MPIPFDQVDELLFEPANKLTFDQADLLQENKLDTTPFEVGHYTQPSGMQRIEFEPYEPDFDALYEQAKKKHKDNPRLKQTEDLAREFAVEGENIIPEHISTYGVATYKWITDPDDRPFNYHFLTQLPEATRAKVQALPEEDQEMFADMFSAISGQEGAKIERGWLGKFIERFMRGERRAEDAITKLATDVLPGTKELAEKMYGKEHIRSQEFLRQMEEIRRFGDPAESVHQPFGIDLFGPVDMAPELALSVGLELAGGPALVAAYWTARIAPESYQTLKDKGYDDHEARLGGLLSGLGQGAVEMSMSPLRFVRGPKAGSFASRSQNWLASKIGRSATQRAILEEAIGYVARTGIETGEEIGQAVVQDIVEAAMPKVFAQIPQDSAAGFDNYREAMEILPQTIYSVGVLAGTKTLNEVRRSLNEKLAKNNASREVFESVGLDVNGRYKTQQAREARKKKAQEIIEQERRNELRKEQEFREIKRNEGAIKTQAEIEGLRSEVEVQAEKEALTKEEVTGQAAPTTDVNNKSQADLMGVSPSEASPNLFNTSGEARPADPTSQMPIPEGRQETPSQPSLQDVPSGPSMTRAKEPSTTAGGIRTVEVGELGTRDASSNKIITQPRKSAEELLQGAQEVAPRFTQLVENAIADVPGAKLTQQRVKGMERVQEKLESGRPTWTISDYLGARVTVENDGDAAKILEKFQVVEYEDVHTDLGYTGAHAQVVLPNGMTAELQINSPEMFDMQKNMHPLYKRARNLARHDLKQTEEYKAIRDHSNAQYEEARQKAKKRQAKQGTAPAGFRRLQEGAGNYFIGGVTALPGQGGNVGQPKYFVQPQEIPIEQIKPSKAYQAKSVSKANQFMREASEGLRPKRHPIALKPNADGTFTVRDGNATYQNARLSGWRTMSALVLTDDQYSAYQDLMKTVPKGRDVEIKKPKRIVGNHTQIHQPQGPPIAAQYVVMELEDIHPSHNFKRSDVPTRNEFYPDGLQPRSYEKGSAEHTAVLDHARNQEPRYWVSEHPGADNGPPSVSDSGVVINGNSRVMTLQVAARKGEYGWYKDALAKEAERFGIPENTIRSMKNPVLVRAVPFEADTPTAHAFARVGNISTTQSQSPVREAASLRQGVDLNVLAELPLDQGQTFGQAVTGDSAAAKKFRKSLADALPVGVHSEMFKDDGNLTGKGVDLVRNMLLLEAFDIKLVESLGRNRPGVANSLQGAIPQILRIQRDFPPNRNLGPQLEEALWFLIDHGEVKVSQSAAEAKRNIKLMENDLLSQGVLVPGTAPIISPGGRMMLDYLIRDGHAPGRFRKTMRSVVADLEMTGEGSFWSEMGNTDYVEGLAKILGVNQRPAADFGVEARLGELEGTASSGGATAASRPGGINDDFPIVDGEMSGAVGRRMLNKPVPLPEMVQIATEIMGNVPIIKKLRKNLGLFKAKNYGEIIIDPKVARSPTWLSKILSHEIGHLIDYSGLHKTLSRGNLLGRLNTLRKFMKHELDGVKNKDIKEELVNLTWWYTPLINPDTKQPINPGTPEFDAAKSRLPRSFVKYRESSRELYAEALSVWLRSPGTLESMAPNFYRELQDKLDRKPTVVDAYVRIQELLNGDTEEISENRRSRITEGFSAGHENMRAAAEAKREAELSPGEAIVQFLSDYMLDKLAGPKEAATAGRPRGSGREYDQWKQAEYLLDELYMQNSDTAALVRYIDTEIHAPMKEAGVTDDQIGEYLFLRRVLGGDRKTTANPLGFDPASATEQLRSLRQSMGAEAFNTMQVQLQLFNQMVFDFAEQMTRAGGYVPETFETLIRPNKDNYAAFAVVKYLEDRVSPMIHEQVGTFREIANPWHATIMKVVAMQRLANLLLTKNELTHRMNTDTPGKIEKKDIPWGQRDPKGRPAPGNGWLRTMEEGKPVVYEVPERVSRAFENQDIMNIRRYSKLMQSYVYRAFHPLFVTYSPGFLTGNPFRDLRRTYHNLGAVGSELRRRKYIEFRTQGMSKKEARKASKRYKITMADVLIGAFGAIPAAARRARNQPDDTVSQMILERALSVPYTEVAAEIQEITDLAEVKEDTKRVYDHLRPLGKNAGLLEKSAAAPLRALGHVLAGLHLASEVEETATKIAGWRILKDRGFDTRERAYFTRKLVGTPDYNQYGTITPMTNALWMYSKVRWNGLQADLSLGFGKDTAWDWWWRRMMWTVMPTTLTKAALYGWFGPTLAHWFSLIPDWAMNNYDVIPLGTFTDDDDEEKAVFLTIPTDDVGRMLKNIWSRMIDVGVEVGGGETRAQSAEILFNEMLGETKDTFLPNLNPAIDITWKWGEYLAGRNPIDNFTGDHIIPRTAWEARGWYAGDKMIQWTLDKSGALKSLTQGLYSKLKGFTGFQTTEDTRQPTFETTLKNVPALSRLLRVSNRGMDAAVWGEIENEDRERQRFKLSNITAASKELTVQQHLLNRRKLDKMTPKERIDRKILNRWYGQTYLPLTKEMLDLSNRGMKNELDDLGDVLDDSAGNMIRSGYASDGMRVVGSVLARGKPKNPEKVKDWERDISDAKIWIKEGAHNPLMIARQYIQKLLTGGKPIEGRTQPLYKKGKTIRGYYVRMADNLAAAKLATREDLDRIYLEEIQKAGL